MEQPTLENIRDYMMAFKILNPNYTKEEINAYQFGLIDGIKMMGKLNNIITIFG